MSAARAKITRKEPTAGASKAAKDVVYVDVEDEITSIIDKIESSQHAIVALVLPKRATVLQSIVNMRLLKRSSENAGKKVVLITSEAGLMPLAGAAGLHVAKSLQSKPSIPSAPKLNSAITAMDDESIEADAMSDIEVSNLRNAAEESGDDTEIIELDNSDPTPKKAAKAGVVGAATKKIKKNKSLKIPDFGKFRLLMFGGIVAVLLITIGLIFALVVMPSAKITIRTDSSSATSNLVVTTDGEATAVNEEKNIVPSKLKESKQTMTEKVAATGQKDLGEKATGSVTITNCTDNPLTISAGTGVSKGGITFVTSKSLSLDTGDFTSGGVCKSSGDHVGTVDVVAAAAGEQYNIPAQSGFAVSNSSGDVRASGTVMKGGTTKIVKVVADADVESAKQKLATKQTEAEKSFKKELADSGSYVLEETIAGTEPKQTVTPAVGAEASDVSVIIEVTYTALTLNEDDLKKLLTKDLTKQLDAGKQKLESDDVLKDATVRVTEKKSPTNVTVSLQKTATVLPVIDQIAVKKEVMGKKKGDVQSIISKRPGVKEVDVTFSPGWVSKVPKKESKVTILVEAVRTGSGN